METFYTNKCIRRLQIQKYEYLTFFIIIYNRSCERIRLFGIHTIYMVNLKFKQNIHQFCYFYCFLLIFGVIFLDHNSTILFSNLFTICNLKICTYK